MTGYVEIEKLLMERPTGWWKELLTALPELEPMADTPQSPYYHAEGDVATHTRLTVEACPADGDPDLLWAALLHDLSKPATTEEYDDRISSSGHEQVEAKLADELLERLGMPEGRRRRIVWAVRHHTFHLACNWQVLPRRAKGIGILLPTGTFRCCWPCCGPTPSPPWGIRSKWTPTSSTWNYGRTSPASAKSLSYSATSPLYKTDQ